MILKSVTVSKTGTGKYYVSILYEYQKEIKKKDVKESIGLDFSMTHFYIDHEGFWYYVNKTDNLNVEYFETGC